MSTLKLTRNEEDELLANGKVAVYRIMAVDPLIITDQTGMRYLQIRGRGVFFDGDPNKTCPVCSIGDSAGVGVDGIGVVEDIRVQNKPWRWEFIIKRNAA